MKSDKISVRLLRQIPVFANMNETECRQLADVASIESLAPGERVLQQGEACRNLWIVLDGTCEVVRRLDADDPQSDSVVLAVLEPFQHFGEMSFFHPAPHSADVRAGDAVRVLRISHTDYQDLIEEGIGAAYKLAFNVVRDLAERMRRMDDWVAELLTAQAQQESSVAEWSQFRDKLFNRWSL